MTPFQRCLPVILGFEGGYSNNPADRGGPTNRGVTQATYTAWRKRHGLFWRPVSECTDQETQSVYYGGYWQPAGCDTLTLPVALVVFDSAVQHGVGLAIRFLQEVGPDADALCERRLRYYAGIIDLHPSQSVFLAGWKNRIAKLLVIADGFALEPPDPPDPPVPPVPPTPLLAA